MMSWPMLSNRLEISIQPWHVWNFCCMVRCSHRRRWPYHCLCIKHFAQSCIKNLPFCRQKMGTSVQQSCALVHVVLVKMGISCPAILCPCTCGENLVFICFWDHSSPSFIIFCMVTWLRLNYQEEFSIIPVWEKCRGCSRFIEHWNANLI